MHGYNFTVRRGVRAHCAKICCVLGIAALLTGCTGNSKVGRVLGFEKSTPDEFAVVDDDLDALEANSRRNLDYLRTLVDL